MITVVSTGFRHPQKAACLASVAMQMGVTFEHVYVEASEQTTPKGPLENFHDVVMTLPPDRIVAWLDGDDRLFDEWSLATVARIYERAPETLVTYGQWAQVDRYGRWTTGRAAQVETDEPRKEPWRASHLKTFRAGLFQKIRRADLCDERGEFLNFTIDCAVMFPLLEMAGRDRSVFNPVVVYVYDTTHCTAMAKNAEEMRIADAIGARLRAMSRYERISTL
jgi:hypothetical protein